MRRDRYFLLCEWGAFPIVNVVRRARGRPIIGVKLGKMVTCSKDGRGGSQGAHEICPDVILYDMLSHRCSRISPVELSVTG